MNQHPQANVDTDRPPKTDRAPILRWLLVLAAGLAALEVSQVYVGSLIEGRPAEWSGALRILLSWAVLALLIPPVVLMARRVPLPEKRTWGRFAAHGAAATAFAMVNLAGTAAIGVLLSENSAGWSAVFGGMFRVFFVIMVVTYGAIVAATWTADYRYQVRRQLRDGLQLRAQLAEARLEALRRHLDPHFLFNTLNGISTLAMRDGTTQVVEALELLGELLQESLLGGDGQLIPLEREILLLDKYLALQRLRFPERLRVEYEVPGELRAMFVPALVLQPLVENAIRHGLERTSSPVLVSVVARRDDGHLALEVRDDGPGPKPGEHADGLGLSNTRERLDALFGRDASLELSEAEPRGTLVSLRVPLLER